MVVRCIEERASAFQGGIPIENMEQVQVVKYFLPRVSLTKDIMNLNNSENITIGSILLAKKLKALGIELVLFSFI
jgi:hypothetical protein